MKRLFNGMLRLGMVLLLLAAFAVPASAQNIKVTFILNMATHPDTVIAKHFVQVRGAYNGKTGAVLPGGKKIDWNASSDLVLTNIGGDYWRVTFDMPPDDTLRYKFWTGFTSAKETSNNTGWENDIKAATLADDGNRSFVSSKTKKDTTLAIQFYNGSGQKQDQYWKPFVSKTDSAAIYFRINMGGVTENGRFNPASNGPVGVRGDDVKSGKVLDWGATKVVLKRETSSVDKGSFWSGVAYFPKTGANAVQAGSEQNYKFFINNATGDAWEGGNNRTFKFAVGLKDTTLAWSYFDKVRPTGRPFVQATITFRMNLKSLQDVGLFDRSKGDKVAVIGAKGWDRPANYINMAFNSLLQEWTVAEPFNLQLATDINYKYFIIWDSTRTKVGNPNYIPNLVISSPSGEADGWEEPGVTGGGNRLYSYGSTPQQTPAGDFGRAQHFFNSVLPEGAIKTPLSVTWNIDMKPATDRATNPVQTLFRRGPDSVFIYIDDPLWAVTQGRRPGRPGRYELKDPDNDGVYSGTFALKIPLWFQVGFKVAYTTATPGAVVTTGEGLAKGRRYYQFIKPASISSTGPTWPSSYNFPTIAWKEKDLPVETPPTLITAVNDKPIAGGPEKFDLLQNYPNPFNPATKITYQIATTSDVKIGVYNLMGQLVKTLVDEKLIAGKYSTIWAGDNALGKPAPTGIYFMKMQAGDFSKVHKMILAK